MTRWSSLRRSRVSGVLAGAALGAVVALALVAVVGAGPSQRSEGVKLVGQYRIEVFDANGGLVAVREGHNAITGQGKELIALCLSGVLTGECGTALTPPGLTGVIAVGTKTSPCGSTIVYLAHRTATNTLVLIPTGWRSSATFAFSSAATITEAGAAQPIGPFAPTVSQPPATGTTLGTSVALFNCLAITPALTVAPGDSAVVTITFTVQ